MSIDVHPGAPPAAFRDLQRAVDADFDRDESWAETVITFVAATVTIGFVSFVAVLMAMA
jgi:hypothetical protein